MSLSPTVDGTRQGDGTIEGNGTSQILRHRKRKPDQTNENDHLLQVLSDLVQVLPRVLTDRENRLEPILRQLLSKVSPAVAHRLLADCTGQGEEVKVDCPFSHDHSPAPPPVSPNSSSPLEGTSQGTPPNASQLSTSSLAVVVQGFSLSEDILQKRRDNYKRRKLRHGSPVHDGDDREGLLEVIPGGPTYIWIQLLGLRKGKANLSNIVELLGPNPTEELKARVCQLQWVRSEVYQLKSDGWAVSFKDASKALGKTGNIAPFKNIGKTLGKVKTSKGQTAQVFPLKVAIKYMHDKLESPTPNEKTLADIIRPMALQYLRNLENLQNGKYKIVSASTASAAPPAPAPGPPVVPLTLGTPISPQAASVAVEVLNNLANSSV